MQEWKALLPSSFIRWITQNNHSGLAKRLSKPEKNNHLYSEATAWKRCSGFPFFKPG
jgi:hypothetical protein